MYITVAANACIVSLLFSSEMVIEFDSKELHSEELHVPLNMVISVCLLRWLIVWSTFS